MKNVVKKAMSVMLLLTLTVTLNVGIVGTIPQSDNDGIAPMHDEEVGNEFYI